MLFVMSVVFKLVINRSLLIEIHLNTLVRQEIEYVKDLFCYHI